MPVAPSGSRLLECPQAGQAIRAPRSLGTCLTELGKLIECRLDWNGETDTLRPAQHQRIDADNLTMLSHQRPTAVAWVDGRVCLEESFGSRAALTGEDPRCHCVRETGRVSDGV